ncbi:MAG: hypothetical protein LUC18_04695 [Porphyromonadaceae bacterium]|nr:hypothetical protein [Porphyromonadaceae bacterium]
MSNLFDRRPVKVPNRSGFDMSHSNSFTASCGTLVPCHMDYLLPNDTVKLSVPNIQVQLPPMATDFYGFIEAKIETFFVPFRILYGGWREVISPVLTSNGVDAASYVNFARPCISITAGAPFPEYYDFLRPCSLGDYLGYSSIDVKDISAGGGVDSMDALVDIFPFLAYQMIYQEWYRDSRLQLPLFCHPGSYDSEQGNANAAYLKCMPYSSFESDTNTSARWTLSAIYGVMGALVDGSTIFDLRQRNWPKDYFTNASYQPQQGDAASVEIADGEFTIASLRAANALQQFLERMNVAGSRYQDVINVNYGIYPSDAVSQRPIYLGSMSVPVYTKSVYQTSNPITATASSNSSNPFNSVGSKYGASQAVGNGGLVRSFTATEHGILMSIFSLVPKPQYSGLMRKQLFAVGSDSIPYPTLAGIGDQSIMKSELVGVCANSSGNDYDTVFGYTQRYSEYKFQFDEVHGLLRDGQSLSSFQLQRSFDDNVLLGSDFIQIPTDYLDQVAAVSGDVSKYGCWVDAYFNYKKVSTLPAYSIPTLEDAPSNGHYETFNLGGTRL